MFELEIEQSDISQLDIFDFNSYNDNGLKKVGEHTIDKELCYEVYNHFEQSDLDSLTLNENGEILKEEEIVINILKYYNKI